MAAVIIGKKQTKELSVSIYKNGKLVAGGSQALPLLCFMWSDHQLNHPSWLNSTTFSWQSGAVYQAAYQHLVDDYNSVELEITLADNYRTYLRYPAGDVTGWYCWKRTNGSIVVYTQTENVVVGDYVWTTPDSSQPYFDYISNVSNLAQTETIAGITITYYQAPDGHKLVLPNQETNVTAIYTATGVAWYYIIDTTNQRFKLPRSKHNKYADMLGVVGNGKTLGLTNGSTNEGLYNSNAIGLSSSVDGYGKVVYTSIGTTTTFGNLKSIGITTDVSNSGIVAQQEQDTDQYKYLYFYVGNFTQTALENTAGLNTELFNDKVDVGHEVIAFQAPTAQNNYTWYRKYADGWVEQGGFFTKNNTATSQQTVNMPVIMDNNQYQVQTHMADDNESDYVFEVQVKNQTTTGFDVRIIAGYQTATWTTNYRFAWFVCGKAA